MLAVVLSLVLNGEVGAQAVSLEDTIARVKPSVVGVGTYLPSRSPAAQLRGTGFVIGDGTLVATNEHVLPERLNRERRETLAVFQRGPNGMRVWPAEQVATDAQHDLALLRLEGEALPALEIGQSDAVREGALMAFTGFPIGGVLGLVPVTHRGIVSAITPIAVPMKRSRQLDPALIARLRDPYKVFQLDATAYPGNSGSPLYEPDTGRVVGVLNMVFVKESKEAVLEKPSGIAYAIPVKHLRELMERVR